MVRLLQGFKTVAFLADAGCYDDAFKLLGALDQISMGIEMYWHPTYQVARVVLLSYVEQVSETPGDWHSIE